MNTTNNIFKALGDSTRYKIIISLLDSKQNMCCTDLSEITNKDLSTISRQLKILEDVDLIVITKINKTKCVKLKNKILIKKLLGLIKKF